MATQIARRPGRGRPAAGTAKRKTVLPTRSITVDGSPEECYRAWRDPGAVSRFLSFVHGVRSLEGKHARWVERESDGDSVEWEVERVEDVANEAIAWRSVPGSKVETIVAVRFERAPGGRGTVVRLGLKAPPRKGALRSLIAKASEKVQAKRELHRFKQWFETGEVATTEGQPSGARSTAVRIVLKGERS